MANWLTLRSIGRRYDAYLYGSRGYRRLLHEAGFAEVQVLVAKGSYNNPEAIVPTIGTASEFFFRTMDVIPRSSFRRVVQAAAMKLRLLAQIQYAFVVLGAKSDPLLVGDASASDPGRDRPARS